MLGEQGVQRSHRGWYARMYALFMFSAHHRRACFVVWCVRRNKRDEKGSKAGTLPARKKDCVRIGNAKVVSLALNNLDLNPRQLLPSGTLLRAD